MYIIYIYSTYIYINICIVKISLWLAVLHGKWLARPPNNSNPLQLILPPHKVEPERGQPLGIVLFQGLLVCTMSQNANHAWKNVRTLRPVTISCYHLAIAY